MINSELDPLSIARRSLPPSLHLSSSDESPKQYEIGSFEPRNLEDVAKYGSFMVALMLWKVADTGELNRVSFMPTSQDFDAMYEAGYGMRSRYLPFDEESQMPGIRKVQSTLGFYPQGFRPDEEKLRRDLGGIAQQLDFEPATTNIKQVLSWAWARDLAPSRDILYSIITDPSEVRSVFSVEKIALREQLTFTHLYRFGAEVLRDNDGPLPREELDRRYPDAFSGGQPSSVIKAFFGSYRQFWLEFGVVMYSRGMSAQEDINLGVRHAITKGDSYISHSKAQKLSAEHKLALRPIQRIGYEAFQEGVEGGYQAYLQLHDQLLAQGVRTEILQTTCSRLFEHTPEFEAWLQNNVETLKRLSGTGNRAKFMRDRIRNGLELDSRAVYTWRLREIHKVLKAWELSEHEKRFVFDLIPRINTDEAMGTAPAAPPDQAAFSIHSRPWSRSSIEWHTL